MRVSAVSVLIGLPLALALVWSPTAHAYIDGGTASMMFQMLIAGGLAAVFTLRNFWTQIKTFFASALSKNSSVDEKP